MEALALPFDVLDGPEAQLQRRGLQRVQHLARDQLVQRRGRDVTATLRQPQVPVITAVVAGPLVRLVPSREAMATFAADDQAGQQRRTALRYTLRVVQRAILPEPFLVGQVLVPGDVGGKPALDEDRHLFRRHEPLAPFALPGHGVFLARTVEAVGVGPRVDGVSQDGQDAVVGGRPPLQLPDAPAPLAAEPQLQVIHRQVMKDRVRGAEFLELVEDQPYYGPRLLVWLLNDLYRRHLDVSDGNMQEQLAALGLVPAAAEQAVTHRH